jgi:hypothetical protein
MLNSCITLVICFITQAPGDFEAGNWPLICRPYLKRLKLEISPNLPALKFGELKQLLSAIPNVSELELALQGGVDGFDEEVLTLHYRLG